MEVITTFKTGALFRPSIRSGGKTITCSNSPSSLRLPLTTKLPSVKKHFLTPPQFSLQRINGAENESWMQGYHDVELQVRDYELDQYGVVNNARYAHFVEHGITDLLLKLGIDTDVFISRGFKGAIRETWMKYLSPLKRRDSFVLKMKISEVSATRMRFEYYIFKLTNKEVSALNCKMFHKEKLALEGTSVVVWLDENLRPTRIPTEAKLKLMSYLETGSVEESIHVTESSPI
ncbi:hypothetical protein EJ110_NYTH20171 [Nymphaea thermarum]|nr:hypothetical protein EJ110_NYTH20171 [Nymphaea thermarum]